MITVFEEQEKITPWLQKQSGRPPKIALEPTRYSFALTFGSKKPKSSLRTTMHNNECAPGETAKILEKTKLVFLIHTTHLLPGQTGTRHSFPKEPLCLTKSHRS